MNDSDKETNLDHICACLRIIGLLMSDIASHVRTGQQLDEQTWEKVVKRIRAIENRLTWIEGDERER